MGSPSVIVPLTILLCVFFSSSWADLDPKHSLILDDVGLNITEFIKKHGYPVETHEVTTEDGYILALHRIPHGRKNGSSTEKRPAVLLMIGLIASPMDWVNSGPDDGLGFLLADAGYDVWLGSQRGNTLSRKHLYLDPVINASKFWDFSFHEIGVYDIAAKIDHILFTTGHGQVTFVGHSQGNTALYALLATKPEYNQVIRVAVGLGPVAYLQHSTHPLMKFLAEKLTLIDIAASVAGIHEIAAHLEILTLIGKEFCADGEPTQVICADIIFAFGGFDTILNKTLIPLIASSDPAGGSLKQVLHFVQMYKSGMFRQYDYGFIGNMAKYKKGSPPAYNISHITAPIVLYSAVNDWFNNKQDVGYFASQLPNLVAMLNVDHPKFSHIDFIWGTGVVDLVYKNVFQILNKMNNIH